MKELKRGLMPPSGWSSIVLVTVMLLTVAWSIQAAGWVEGLGVLTLAVLGAVAAGLVLGRLEWMPGLLAHGWSLAIGIVWTTYLGTRILPAYEAPGGYAEATTLERMEAVRNAVFGWIAAARQGSDASVELSGLIFVLATALLLWLLSYVCVRFLVRYVSFWGAVLPAGFALLANLYYAPEASAAQLFVFIMCALLLAVKTSVTLNEEYWRQAHIHYSPDIGLDFLKDGVVVAVAVTGLGLIAPAELRSGRLASVVSSVTQSSASVQSEFNRLFPNLNYPMRGAGGAYSDEMPLTGSISLAGVPIFDVRVDGEADPPRYYRMAVFDTYDGAGWRREATRQAPLEETLAQPPTAARPVTQTFENFQASTRQLYVAPQAVWFDIEVDALVTGPGDAPELVEVTPKDPLAVGAIFNAVSLVSEASVNELRGASGSDPEWITERYLALPSSPDLIEVAEHAQEVAGTATSRYDIADALENHLRTYEYSDTIGTPPADRDRVAWFLFEEQRGYCDYYASSFVVMARSLGVPARVAVGYSRGTYSPEAQAFRQHAFDAHSWPEVYFPGYGWIPFEPTAQDPEIDRPLGPDSGEEELPLNESGLDRDDMLPDEDDPLQVPTQAPGAADSSGAGSVASGRNWLLALLSVVGVFATLTVGARFAWERQFNGLTPAQSAFAKLVRLASLLGLRPRTQDTPYEYRARLSRALPEAERDLTIITDAYVRERFSGREGAPDSSLLERALRALRRPLATFAVRERLGRVAGRRGRKAR